ncbi:Zn-ribbon domain-containing OB-fold protein [Mesorhizobium sp. KR9-304]|uniref:Zn-ribbon domain-containing OB-fold protein n=1 Tax=Mesorhizobium sp. KR9-304 TaxID=3156614 RepID=UPI0032B37A74
MNAPVEHAAVNAETKAYWDAARDGRLLVKKCTACGRPHFYPRTQCPHCRSLETEWMEASGQGTIYSWTVMRRASPPVAIAYVTLEEGVTMFTNIVDCDLDALAVGQPVRVAFEQREDGLTIPVFKPA